MLHAGEVDPADGAPRLVGAAAIGTGEDGRPVLVGSHCRACDQEMVPPVDVCPVCGGEDLDRRDQPREGTLYSYTVLHVGAAKWRRPLTVGYVDLSNGVRVFAHLEGEGVTIGEAVELDMATVGKDPDGTSLASYVFRMKGAI